MLDERTLPADVLARLNVLRHTQTEALTADDLGFLTARRDYLRPDEVEHFGLEEKAAKRETPPQTDVVNAAPVDAADVRPAKAAKGKK